MRNKTKFTRLDTIKDTAARTEIARAHTMIALLGVISGTLLWIIYSSIAIPLSLVVLATILLQIIVFFSIGVAYTMKLKK